MKNEFGRDFWLPAAAILVSILAAILMGMVTLRILVGGIAAFPEFARENPVLALLQIFNFVIFGYLVFRKKKPNEGSGYIDHG